MMKGYTFGAVLLAYLAVAAGQLSLNYEGGSPFSKGPQKVRVNNRIAGEPGHRFQPDPKYLLKASVTPLHYKVEIRPVIDTPGNNEPWEQYTAPGHVEITAAADAATNEIVLHRHTSMTISNVTVTEEGGNRGNLTSNADVYDAPNHFQTIRLTQQLAIGRTYKIEMDFVATVWTNKTDGLYAAKYKQPDSSGVQVERQMVSTQFESVGAREAFPCFDEPRFKTTFEWTIYHRDNYTAWCNSNLTGVPTNDTYPGWKKSTFTNTDPVKMPTYLVAIVVADYEKELALQNATDLFKKPVQILGRPHAILDRKGGVGPAEWSSKIINWIEQNYNFPYELPKIDSIGLPDGYFGGGAMENWGLNTYREAYLLHFDDSTESNRKSILSILAHELAHQWFGNLVTCYWWSQIWLNEGFATYLSYEVPAALYPEFGGYLDEMVFDAGQYAMSLDIDNDLPVINHAQTPQEVDSVFGFATYDKGGSLLRMMVGFMGEENFQKGVRDYLQINNYTSVEQERLFSALQVYAAPSLPQGTTLESIMYTWTLKPGYPLVRVTSSALGGDILLSQEIYRDANPQRPPIPGYENELWEVPVKYVVTNSSASVSNAVWLTKDDIVKRVTLGNFDYIHLNPDGTGYYRVLYEGAFFDNLIRAVVANPDAVSAASRSQLIDDYFSFSLYGHSDIKKAMETTKYMKNYVETSHIVWNTVFKDLTKALTVLRFRGELDNLMNYLGPILNSTLRDTRINMTQATRFEGDLAILRAKLLDWACALGLPDCITYAQQVAADYTGGDADKKPFPDIAQVLLCPAVENDISLVDKLLDVLKTVAVEPVPTLEGGRIVSALACVQDPTLEKFNFLLGEALESDTKLYPYAVSLYRRMATRSVFGRDTVFNYLNANLEKFVQSQGVDNAVLIIRDIIGVMTSEEEFQKVEVFKAVHNATLGNKDLNNAAVLSNVNWYATHGTMLNEWLVSENSRP